MAVKKAKHIGGKANYHKARAKAEHWLRRSHQKGPSMEDAFGPLRPASSAPGESVRVKYVLSCKPPSHGQLYERGLFTTLRVVLTSGTLRLLQTMLRKRTWGEITPTIALLDAATGSERGRIFRASFMDEVKPSRFGSGLFEVVLMGTDWKPSPGFVFDTPMPDLKMWAHGETE